MRKHNPKKLSLDTTTLRNLASNDLSEIAGGHSAGPKVACGTLESCSCPKRD